MSIGQPHKRSARTLFPGLAAVVLLATLAGGRLAHADDAVTTSAVARDIKTYCSSIADAARDRRYAIQKKQLAELQADVDKRMKQLDARKAEYEDWLTRRNAFLKAAQANLVDIYSKMDADAAASQLELMDPNVAAAIVMKLAAGKSSAILNNMKAEKAATLAGIIASASDPNTSRNPS